MMPVNVYSILILSCLIPAFTGIIHAAEPEEKKTWIEKTVQLPNGLSMEYVEQGAPSGIPVVLLHGWTDSWNSFERVLPLLPESYHVFAPSMRGHGDSDKPFEGYSIRDFSDDVAAFMDAMKLDSAVFVGFSMGGVVTKRFTLDHPDRVDGLILIGTPVNLDNQPYIDELWELLLTLRDPIDPGFIRSFNADVPVKPVPEDFMEHINQANMKVPAHVWRDAFKGVWDANLMGEVSAIKSPVLVLWGDHDSFTTIDDQKELASAILGSEFKVYPGNGHAIHWEDPEIFSNEMIQFIEQRVR